MCETAHAVSRPRRNDPEKFRNGYIPRMPGDPISFGPFLLSPDNGTLIRDRELLAVGLRGARLLGALLRNPGQVVTKAELMDAAWPGMVVEESNLSVQIASLRKTLGPSPGGGAWIATVPRVGYRFIDSTEAGASSRTTRAAHAQPVIPSLAVLPFQNLGSDPEQDFFADGAVEDIITALSRFTSFAVIARNSSFVYKGRVVDVRRVASELGVRYILEGSVQRAGNLLRIRAQLVDGETAFTSGPGTSMVPSRTSSSSRTASRKVLPRSSNLGFNAPNWSGHAASGRKAWPPMIAS